MRSIRLLTATLLMIGACSSCKIVPPSLSATESREFSDSPKWSYPANVVGQVPAHVILGRLADEGLLLTWPSGRDAGSLTILPGMNLRDVRDLVEVEMRWVYADKAFHRVSFAMSAEELRLFRYRRVLVPVSIRFVRVNAGIGLEEIAAGTTLYQYCGLFPDGQDTTFSTGQERGFTEGIVGVESSSQTAVRTTRKTVSSGIEIDGFVTLMPGGWARFVSDLSVSSFTGTSLDRATTKVPLSVDIPRGKWQSVHVFSAMDLAGSWQFGSSPTIRLGGDWVRVDVRVD